jgi:hypothetical protein
VPQLRFSGGEDPRQGPLGCDAVQSCGRIQTFHLVDASSMVLRNVGILPQLCRASQPKRLRLVHTWVANKLVQLIRLNPIYHLVLRLWIVLIYKRINVVVLFIHLIIEHIFSVYRIFTACRIPEAIAAGAWSWPLIFISNDELWLTSTPPPPMCVMTRTFTRFHGALWSYNDSKDYISYRLNSSSHLCKMVHYCFKVIDLRDFLQTCELKFVFLMTLL